MEADDARHRRLARWMAPLLAVAAAVSLGYAIDAYRHAPSVSDLYNLVYHDIRPRRPEGTATFLFGFPAMLWIGCGLLVARTRGWRFSGSRQMSPEGAFVLWSVWTASFLIGSLHRSWVVLHHHW